MISIKQGNTHNLVFNVRDTNLNPSAEIANALEIVFSVKDVIQTDTRHTDSTAALILKKFSLGQITFGTYAGTIIVRLEPQDTKYIQNPTNPDNGDVILSGDYFYGLEVRFNNDDWIELNLLDETPVVNNKITLTGDVVE